MSRIQLSSQTSFQTGKKFSRNILRFVTHHLSLISPFLHSLANPLPSEFFLISSMERKSKNTRNVISLRFSLTWKRRKRRRRNWREHKRNNWRPRKTSPRTSTRLVCWMGGKRKWVISGLNLLVCSEVEVNIQRRECWRYVSSLSLSLSNLSSS